MSWEELTAEFNAAIATTQEAITEAYRTIAEASATLARIEARWEAMV